MDKIRAAIVGCGFIANGKHLPSMAYLGNIEPVAFCDVIPERAEETARKWGKPDALVCTDYREVLERSDIDVVHVCTPNRSHAEITVACLEAGKHVMCEKPMAKTAAEAKAMLDAAKANGKLLTIAFQNRFREDSLFLKNLCQAGELGEIYFAKAFATRRRAVPVWGVFMNKEEQGGGPLIDIASHALDLTLWMMDNYEPELVLGSTFDKIAKIGSQANIMGPWDPAKFEVEDSAFGMVRFRNGAVLMLESSWALNTVLANEAMTLLCGTKAGADMFPPTGPIVRESDFQAAPSYHVRVNGEQAGKLYIKNYTIGGSFLRDGAPKEQFVGGIKEMETWVKAVRGEGELVVKPEQAYVVSLIIDKIYESARKGDVVRID